MPWDDSKTLKA